jgi:hypothetical protein
MILCRPVHKPSNPNFDECVGFLWVNGQGVLLGGGLKEIKKE